ncbi:MAG: nucleotidyl transferase AbiEii/AbiGii toxin family protein [Candidatus Omnitrophica bacterium]|nr:nucleotidyl transferase AbiEii/AbiGii toxin family protein [Candidatus Omnitrophota bacterium]
MKVSQERILEISQETGFRPDVIEKVVYLLTLLNALNSHPFLKGRWALKGGTALNLFVLNIPRLSVDIDLNYIGAIDRETMMEERPKVEQAVQDVFSREGVNVKRIPAEHAGGKWRLTYSSALAPSGNLDVDLNFMFRQPLWDIEVRDSHALGAYQAKSIPMVELHELAAGKLAALFSRRQARDIFDAHQALQQNNLVKDKLRLAFVVYGAMNRKDWRTISLDDVSCDIDDLRQKLIPVMKGRDISNSSEESPLGEQLVGECKKSLSMVYPLKAHEIQYLDYLLDKGEIEPELLTEDSGLQERIKRHPMLLWKVLNVRKNFK